MWLLVMLSARTGHTNQIIALSSMEHRTNTSISLQSKYLI